MPLRVISTLVCVVSISSLLSCSQGMVLEGDDLVILEGAILFEGSDGQSRPDRVLVIEGDRIANIGTVGDFIYPDEATIIDVSGRYILPGLMDMHAHIVPEARADVLRTLLAHGITTARSTGSVGGDTGDVEVRALLESGELLGPRFFAAGVDINQVPSRMPASIEIESADELRAEIQRQAELGVDMIKLYWDITPELFEVAVEEAHSLGLLVAGHQRTTSWTEAAALGVDILVHCGADGPTWELIPDEQIRARVRGQDPPRYGPDDMEAAEYYRLVSENMKLDGAEMDALVSALLENDVEVNPTLVTMESLYHGDEAEFLARMETERMPATIMNAWDAYFGPGWKRANPFVTTADPTGAKQDFTSAKPFMSIAKAIVRTLHERGVRITAGSDIFMPWLTPGVSLHRELELMVEAGISPRDVLLIATRNGAEAVGMLAEIGTIEEGKLADLVVLTEDPIEDIRNTRSIEAVYKSGKRYAPEALMGGN